MTAAAIARVMAGVLMAITSHGPTLPEGGTFYRWWRDPELHHYTISPGQRYNTSYRVETRDNLIQDDLLRLSPEKIRPFPKAQKRKGTCKGRPKGR
ncbi:hypothetical protein AVEN_2475-1 [Araneus ventricosus]|uniref:Uncharacterized protein n=1 Tax=Araneus ventricosus TaxID=182803 RepID=A0A4Y2P794_ARAVE|nr:hypothetical protein AVEN_2475-1 [Araneus ventricosus]